MASSCASKPSPGRLPYSLPRQRAHAVVEHAALCSGLPHEAVNVLAISGEVTGFPHGVLAANRHHYRVGVVKMDVEVDRRLRCEKIIDALARPELHAFFMDRVGS